MKQSTRNLIALGISLALAGWICACGETETKKCGNGVLDSDEQCDGTVFGANTCESMGFSSGDLQCTAVCSLNTDACLQKCGNNRLDPEEDCDGKKLRSGTCQSMGYTGGSLACRVKDCTYDLSGCEWSMCGNNQLDPGEQCDGDQLRKTDCMALGYDSGQLGCTADCVYNTDNCQGEPCGNGFREDDEECDLSDHNGRTCLNMGFDSGSLGCTSQCEFDTRNCGRQCQDDALDNTTLQSAHAVTMPFSQGDLVMCGHTDEDWFKINMLARHRYSFQVIFSNDAGDVDAYLYNRADGAHPIALSASVTDNEVFDYVVPNNATASHYLVVKRYLATETSQTYSLTISDEGAVDCFLSGECQAEETCINNRCVEAQEGDTCADPIVIDTLPYSQTGVDLGMFRADFHFAQPTCTGFYNWGRDVFYRLDLGANQTLTATITSGFDASLALVNDCIELPAPEDSCLVGIDVNSNPAGTSTETLTYTPDSPETVYLVVDHFQNGPDLSSTFDLSITVE